MTSGREKDFGKKVLDGDRERGDTDKKRNSIMKHKKTHRSRHRRHKKTLLERILRLFGIRLRQPLIRKHKRSRTSRGKKYRHREQEDERKERTFLKQFIALEKEREVGDQSEMKDKLKESVYIESAQPLVDISQQKLGESTPIFKKGEVQQSDRPKLQHETSSVLWSTTAEDGQKMSDLLESTISAPTGNKPYVAAQIPQASLVAEAPQAIQPLQAQPTESETSSVVVDQEEGPQRRLANQQRKYRRLLIRTARIGMDGIAKEFRLCRTYLPKAATREAFDANPDRVRFHDVICIDQSRIILEGCAGLESDFIHASRVPIGDNDNQMILTQLPMANTVAHFWDMVWQENVEVILLFLTPEEWKAHAEHINLLPTKTSCLNLYDLVVTLTEETSISSDWVFRILKLSRNNQIRRIFWHHYLGWQQDNAPTELQTIWQINSAVRKQKRPVLCMSLAGAGRAGTYAVLEVAHQRLHDTSRHDMNIEECVHRIRDSRMHAIQTAKQLRFIYFAMLRHICDITRLREKLMADSKTSAAVSKFLECEKNFQDEALKWNEEETDISVVAG